MKTLIGWMPFTRQAPPQMEDGVKTFTLDQAALVRRSYPGDYMPAKEYLIWWNGYEEEVQYIYDDIEKAFLLPRRNQKMFQTQDDEFIAKWFAEYSQEPQMKAAMHRDLRSLTMELGALTGDWTSEERFK